MNVIQIETIKEVDRLLGIVLEGKVENLPQAMKAKELVNELIEFKDFNKHHAWKLVQD